MYKKAMKSEKPFDMVILDLINKVGKCGAVVGHFPDHSRLACHEIWVKL